MRSASECVGGGVQWDRRTHSDTERTCRARRADSIHAARHDADSTVLSCPAGGVNWARDYRKVGRYYKSLTAAVLVAEIREAPDVAETDEEPDDAEYEVHLSRPLRPLPGPFTVARRFLDAIVVRRRQLLQLRRFILPHRCSHQLA